MILTKTHSKILFKVVIQKCKHKSTSLDQHQFDSLCNMINVLNTVELDQTEIGGVHLIRYKKLNYIKEAFVPTTISFSGTRKGADFKSKKYKEYCPVEAGFMTKEQAKKLNIKVKGDENPSEGSKSFLEAINPSMSHTKRENFAPFLTPQDFEIIQGLLLANMKKDTAESQFSDYEEKLGSFTDYADKMTTSSDYCKPSATKYFPVLSDNNFYLDSQYVQDVEEMLEDWFRACLDAALTGSQQQ